MKKLENALESMIFNSRWLLAPFYIGLVFSIVILVVKFVQELAHMVPRLFVATESEMILSILTLVDVSLIANLLLIIIFSGYENFVSKIDVAEHVDRPSWMGKVDFSGLKIKLIASIVAISAIELLKSFVNIAAMDNVHLAWKVGIHLTLVFSGVMFALMDRIAESGKKERAQSSEGAR